MDADKDVFAIQAVSMYNNLCGNDVLSAFELAKDFTRPRDGDNIAALLSDILDPQLKLQAKRKLALILRSKATFDVNVNTGDTVDVYCKTNMENRSV